LTMETISQERIFEVAASLLARVATRYPKNYLEKIITAFETEESQASKRALASIIENILYAGEEARCICQDTGVPTFHVYLNPDISIKGDITEALTEATIKATAKVPLRQNVIEPFSYKNLGNNTGWGVPFIHYHYSSQSAPMKIRTELKGFGGEIKSSFDWIMTSSRNMENAVLAYVLNSVILSKGEACLPSFLGVGVGGYAAEAVPNAQNAIFRELTTTHPEKTQFEQRLLRCVNRLGLGTIGLGGNVTAMGIYVATRGTHTAVAPVAVAHQCWASRGSEVLISENKVDYITPHVEASEVPVLRERVSQKLSESKFEGKVRKLTTPVSISDLRELRVGDIVYINGRICTSRDSAHRRMVENLGKVEQIPQEILTERTIFHCGPVVAQDENGNWQVNAAGPTTSSRFTDDAALLAENGIFNVVIGKGTMGKKMINALKGRGVYLLAIGGCAIVYQKKITHADVKWLDLGYPEAVWIFDVNHFGPLVVSIDSEGNSLTKSVMDDVYENARNIYKDEGLNPHEKYVQYPVTFAGLPLEEIIADEKAKMS